jgi:PAS domain S-box-containing protein
LNLFFLNAGVSEQKRSNAALRESEAQLHAIVENLDEGVVVSALDGQLLQWNRAALKLHGYSDSAQEYRRFPELVDTLEFSTLEGASVPVEQWPLARVLRGEKVQNLELRMRRIGTDWERILNYGGTLVHDADDRPLMAIVTVRDITERKRAEEMLRASEERYRTLFESNPSPMWVYDRETLAFLAVNAAAVRHYGYSQDEFLAMSIKDIRPVEDLPELMNNLRQRTDGLDEVTQWRHRRKDGALIDVEITSHDLRWLGRPGSLVLINDVTARKRAEDQVLQVNAELEERVRRRTVELETVNKELESFSYSVSHDLRAPLRHIEGYVELVVRHAGQTLNEKSRAHLQTVSESVTEMGQLIDDLLDFSRMGKVEMRQTTIELDPIVGETIADLDREIRGRNVVWKRGPLPRVHADGALMKQVFVNLISNAVKYTRPRDPAEIEIGCAHEKNGEAVLFVHDNGVGFDMKYADKLFGVFQRLHHADEFEGTGVGLATVQRIISRHGGRIWAEAALNGGATFFFTLTKPQRRRKG